ncbi:MAG: nuclear transport factor 2 family protein [Anaerolineaceae bacterium]|jgi:hypothetical protein
MIESEFDAAEAYARAWNRLDCTEFVELLAPDASYASQWVFEELEGKEAIEKYLTNKIKAVKEGKDPIFAELTTATESYPGKDCVAMAQGDKQVVAAVVIFEVNDSRIKRIDMCMPNLFNLKRSGNYPR